MSGKRNLKNKDADDKVRKRIEDLKNEIKKLDNDIEKETKETEKLEASCKEEAVKSRILQATKNALQEKSHDRVRELGEKAQSEIEEMKQEIYSIVEKQKRVKVETVNIKSKVMSANCELADIESAAKKELKMLKDLRKHEHDLMISELRDLEALEKTEIELVKCISSFIPGAPRIERDVMQPQDFTRSSTMEEQLAAATASLRAKEAYRNRLLGQIAALKERGAVRNV